MTQIQFLGSQILIRNDKVALDPDCCCEEETECADPSIDHYVYICPYDSYCVSDPFVGVAINIGALETKNINMADYFCNDIEFRGQCLPFYDGSCYPYIDFTNVLLKITYDSVSNCVSIAIQADGYFERCLGGGSDVDFTSEFLYTTSPACCFNGVYSKGTLATRELYGENILGCGPGGQEAGFGELVEPPGADSPNGFYVAPLSRIPSCD